MIAKVRAATADPHFTIAKSTSKPLIQRTFADINAAITRRASGKVTRALAQLRLLRAGARSVSSGIDNLPAQRARKAYPLSSMIAVSRSHYHAKQAGPRTDACAQNARPDHAPESAKPKTATRSVHVTPSDTTYVPEHEIRYYRDPMQRLVRLHSSFQEIMTGLAYQSPWPRPDAQFR